MASAKSAVMAVIKKNKLPPVEHIPTLFDVALKQSELIGHDQYLEENFIDPPREYKTKNGADILMEYNELLTSNPKLPRLSYRKETINPKKRSRPEDEEPNQSGRSSKTQRLDPNDEDEEFLQKLIEYFED